MANSVLLPPEEKTEARVRQPLRPLDNVTLHGELAETEQGVFSSLLSSIQDAFFPKKLPPLVLTSQPVAVADRMAVKRDPTSVAISAVINVGLVAFVLWIAARQTGVIAAPKTPPAITLVEPPPPPPLKLPPKAVSMGGGGGQKGIAPVTKGSPPPPSPQQLNPPKLKVEDAKLTPPVTVNSNIKMAQNNLPNFGMPNAPNVGVSMGNGKGTGIGSGDGNGVGPGTGGGTGDGVYTVGGGVSAPVALYTPDPEFSEEARKAKFAGNVIVYLQVDTNGRPTHIRVTRGVGLGLDEKAVEAVRQYKFKPGMKNGHPVVVEMNIEVDFQIF